MATGEPNASAPSPVGCGCGLLVTVVLAVLLGFTWYAWYQGESFEESLRDPRAREERSREILGYDELPEGYHPMGGLRMPFAMEMAMLSDRDPAPGEEISGAADAFRERGFVLMKTRAREDRARELDAFFSGERAEIGFFAETDLAFEAAERVGRGAIELPEGVRVRWVAERGRVALGGSGEGREAAESPAEGRQAPAAAKEAPAADEQAPAAAEKAPAAVEKAPAAVEKEPTAEEEGAPEDRQTFLTRLLIECPAGDRLRVALWFEPVPKVGGTAGTPADPEAIRRFLRHFELCR